MVYETKMLLNEKQTDKWIKWFIKNYKDYCEVLPDGRLWIPIIYSEDPEETEKEHKEKRMKEIKHLMWRKANSLYTHRGWRTETYAEVQFNALWLYNWPIFKSTKERKCLTKHSFQIKELMKRMIEKAKGILGLTNWKD